MVAPAHPALDPDAVETRTQDIGRELTAAVKSAHAHFSVLNRWTEEVLAWCLADAHVKSAVLRFIDVLPSLEQPRDVAHHLREYFPTGGSRLPLSLRVGAALARPGLLTAPAVALVVRQVVERVARQFIAESGPAGIRDVIERLAARGATCSLDVLGEQVRSEAEADAYAAQYGTVLREAAAAYASLPAAALLRRCGPIANLSVKASALTARFDPLCADGSIARAFGRLRPILRQASACGALVNLDMEHYELRDLTLALARHGLDAPEPRPPLGIVIQAYLRDSEETVAQLLTWLAMHHHTLTVRLVKGAYWDYEVAVATQRHWPVPVFQDKGATDAAFERLTVHLLGAHPRVTTAIASHNLRSIAHAMAVAEALKLAPHTLEFQLLYGMGDALHAAIVARGYPVRIYTPIGALIPGMAYLVRRILENTANESFLRLDFLDQARADEFLRPPRIAPARPERRLDSLGEPPLDFSRTDARAQMTAALEAVRSRLGALYPLRLGDGDHRGAIATEVRNPADLETVLGRVEQASASDMDRAVQIACDAQLRWAHTPAAVRIACLRRAAALARERRTELAAWQVLEVGKPWREADADVVEAIDYLEYYAAGMEQLADGRLPQAPGERNEYVYEPRGVTAVISPWNFPVAIPTGMVSAALVSGNAVILKPAEQSPITAMQLVRLLRDAGVPPQVVQCVPGDGETVGAALVKHPSVAQILFTGSRAVGLQIIATAGRVEAGQRVIKHVVAEMGGKNALIVDADADLDAAVAGILTSAFGYGGQKCSAASRLIVHDAVAERLLVRLAAAMDGLVIGDPADPCTDFGPLIDAEAQQRLLAATVEAATAGTIFYRYPAERLPRSGYFVAPIAVTDISPQHRLAREELFGPLLCVFRVPDFDAALALANDTDYALTGGLYSRSPTHIAEAKRTFDVGNLYINRPITGAIVGRQPFGGHRLSGLGTKAGGPDYLWQLMLPKVITEDTRRHGIPLE